MRDTLFLHIKIGPFIATTLIFQWQTCQLNGTYAITSHLGCTRYEFLVASRTERNWRFIAHSCNDFSPNVNPNEKTRLGGVGYMWKDVMQKHIEVGGFHCQVGVGDQIYADKMWREVPLLKVKAEE